MFLSSGCTLLMYMFSSKTEGADESNEWSEKGIEKKRQADIERKSLHHFELLKVNTCGCFTGSHIKIMQRYVFGYLLACYGFNAFIVLN